MPHLEAAFPLDDLEAEATEDALFALGAVAVTLSDAADSPILEPKPGETPLWPTVQVAALFPIETDRAELEAELTAEFGDRVAGFTWRVVEDRVWEAEGAERQRIEREHIENTTGTRDSKKSGP